MTPEDREAVCTCGCMGYRHCPGCENCLDCGDIACPSFTRAPEQQQSAIRRFGAHVRVTRKDLFG